MLRGVGGVQLDAGWTWVPETIKKIKLGWIFSAKVFGAKKIKTPKPEQNISLEAHLMVGMLRHHMAASGGQAIQRKETDEILLCSRETEGGVISQKHIWGLAIKPW